MISVYIFMLLDCELSHLFYFLFVPPNLTALIAVFIALVVLRVFKHYYFSVCVQPDTLVACLLRNFFAFLCKPLPSTMLYALTAQ